MLPTALRLLVPQIETAFHMILWGEGGGCLNCDPVTGNPSEIAPNAQKRVEITLNNDIISRAAIKQINCHAHRAKISNYPVCPPAFCQKACRWLPFPSGSVFLAGFAGLRCLHPTWKESFKSHGA